MFNFRLDSNYFNQLIVLTVTPSPTPSSDFPRQFDFENVGLGGVPLTKRVFSNTIRNNPLKNGKDHSSLNRE